MKIRALDPLRMFHGSISGGAVRLGPVRPDDWLVVGEGLETVLSMMQMRESSGWAALSAGGIKGLILPPEARMVTIAADPDANGIGQKAAFATARRWLAEGRRVKIELPPDVDSDFNDLLRMTHRAV